MCATFTDDDVGKTVVNANGDEVGIVSSVEHGSARVEPDPGITDTIKTKLGWEGTSGDTYPLQEEAVDRVTDDEIHLKGDLSGVGSAGAGTDTEMGTSSRMGEEDEGIGDTDTGSGRDVDRDRDF